MKTMNLNFHARTRKEEAAMSGNQSAVNVSTTVQKSFAPDTDGVAIQKHFSTF